MNLIMVLASNKEIPFPCSTGRTVQKWGTTCPAPSLTPELRRTSSNSASARPYVPRWLKFFPRIIKRPQSTVFAKKRIISCSGIMNLLKLVSICFMFFANIASPACCVAAWPRTSANHAATVVSSYFWRAVSIGNPLRFRAMASHSACSCLPLLAT